MRDRDLDSDETSRLLGPDVSTTDHDNNTTARKTPDPWRTVISVAAFVLILSFSTDLGLVPQTAILQDIVCKNYYSRHTAHLGSSNHTIPVDQCLIEPIQSEVAYINGWRESLETLPAILLAVPYGALADRIGRKPVLLLAVFGCILNDSWVRVVYWFSNIFPVRLVWLGGLGQAIGSGSGALSSITFVLVADVAPVDMRTTTFSYIVSATMVSKVIFVPISGALMAISPWVPILLSTLCMVVAFFVLLVFVPETLPSASAASEGETGEQSSLLAEDGDSQPKVSIIVRVREQLTSAGEVSRWMAKNVKVGLLMSCFFLYFFGMQAFGSLLLLYIEKQLGWSLGKASYIFSLGAGVNLLNLLVLVPAASAFLVKRLNIHEITKDKLIAQASAVFLLVGSVILFFAGSWFPLAAGQILSHLGYAFTVPVRSIMTSMVEQQHFGTLYTSTAVLTYAGALTGAPLFALIFKWGMRLGDFWTGLPFLVGGACYAFVLFVVSVATAKGDKERGGQEDESISVSGGSDGV